MCSISFTDSCKIQHPQQQHTSLVIVITVSWLPGIDLHVSSCHRLVLASRASGNSELQWTLPGKFLTLKFVNASLKDQQRRSFLVSCLAIEGNSTRKSRHETSRARKRRRIEKCLCHHARSHTQSEARHSTSILLSRNSKKSQQNRRARCNSVCQPWQS